MLSHLWHRATLCFMHSTAADFDVAMDTHGFSWGLPAVVTLPLRAYRVGDVGTKNGTLGMQSYLLRYGDVFDTFMYARRVQSYKTWEGTTGSLDVVPMDALKDGPSPGHLLDRLTSLSSRAWVPEILGSYDCIVWRYELCVACIVSYIVIYGWRDLRMAIIHFFLSNNIEQKNHFVPLRSRGRSSQVFPASFWYSPSNVLMELDVLPPEWKTMFRIPRSGAIHFHDCRGIFSSLVTVFLLNDSKLKQWVLEDTWGLLLSRWPMWFFTVTPTK